MLAAPTPQRRRYVLGREIGRGGMGVVYEAQDRLAGSRIAIKSIHVGATAGESGSLPSSNTLTLLPFLAGALDAGAFTDEEAPRTSPLVDAGSSRVLHTTIRRGPGDGQRAALALRTALVQEFRILATLRHPYIISVLDYGLDGAGDPFFTMEYLDGAVPLATAQDAPLQVRVGLLIQIAQALLYLHRRGILHRDLKPAPACPERARAATDP